MSTKSAKAQRKQLRKEAAIAKSKRIGIIMMTVLITVVVSIISLIVFAIIHQASIETYGNANVRIQMLDNGQFSAVFPHTGTRRGVYEKEESENGETLVNFYVKYSEDDVRFEVGRIIDDRLFIPSEWDDGHGHGNILPRR